MASAPTVRAEPARLEHAAADCALPLARLRAAVDAYRGDLAHYRAAAPHLPPPADRAGELDETATRLEGTIARLIEAAEAFLRADPAPAVVGGSASWRNERVHARAELGVGGLGAAAEITAARLTEDRTGPAWRRRDGVAGSDHARRSAAAASRALPWASRATGAGALVLPGIEQAARDAGDPTLSGGVRTARAGAAVTLEGGLGLAGSAVGAKLGVAGTAKAGAALGSVVPGLGTVVGGIVGAALGGIALGAVGRSLRQSSSGLVDAAGRRLVKPSPVRGSASARRADGAAPARVRRRGGHGG